MGGIYDFPGNILWLSPTLPCVHPGTILIDVQTAPAINIPHLWRDKLTPNDWQNINALLLRSSRNRIIRARYSCQFGCRTSSQCKLPLPCKQRSTWFLLQYIYLYTCVYHRWQAVFINYWIFKHAPKPLHLWTIYDASIGMNTVILIRTSFSQTILSTLGSGSINALNFTIYVCVWMTLLHCVTMYFLYICILQSHMYEYKL